MEMKIKNKTFKNIEELTDYIFETWEKIPNDTILRFVEKLSDKMNYTLKHKGEEFLGHNERGEQTLNIKEYLLL